MKRKSARQTIRRLFEIRNRYGLRPAAEKLDLLESLDALAVRSAADARRLHLALCFLRAFPDNQAVFDAAADRLDRFGEIIGGLGDAQRALLADSGIAATELCYPFSCEVAAWLAARYPGVAAIDWPAFDDPARLDELLEHLLHHAETDYFDSGLVSTEEWLRLAAGREDGNDFDWLMAQFRERQHHGRFWTSLYNAAEVPLRCALGDSPLSRTKNRVPVEAAWPRSEGMQSRVHAAKREIARPLASLRRLDRREGRRIIDVGMASLAMRHRETIHFNYANPGEVWIADVGRGVSIAATGLLPEHRYPLECTMGFLILANGSPVGYGGSSMLYRQANTGINIFEEYRGSEAAWLWVQVMRLFHAISGCTRYIANPYQFGEGNSEALKSGAFWFYYRLGFRPVDAGVRELARTEFGRVRRDRGYRTPIDVLRKLATCDMHLTLPGARQAEFFDERWIEFSALQATRQLAGTGRRSRRKAGRDLVASVANDLGIESLAGWSADERRWLARLAPVVAATEPGSWPARDKRSLTRLLRAKAGETEREFVRRFAAHERFFEALRSSCRRAESSGL